MIDTDKYEGHTEGPWHFCLGYDIKSDTYTGINPLKGGGDRVNGPVILSEYQFAKGITGHRADAVLIADAPLLLAEVKRLRKEINQLPIDLHDSLDMILEAHHPEVRESVMSMFGDAWGNNLTGYEE